MPVFPIFLELDGRGCLVAGAGAVGVAKARSLADAGAEVLLVDPSPCEAALELVGARARVRLERRAFRDEDCDGRALVFACTGDEDADASVERACRRVGAICCRADGRGFVSAGAVLRRGEVCVAVSSGGASPVLAAEARDGVATVVGEEYGAAAGLLAELRTRLRGDVADASVRREALGRPLVQEVLAELRAGRRENARAAVERALEAARRAAAAPPGAQEQGCTR